MGTGRKREAPAELCPSPWPERASTDPHAELARRFNLRLRTSIGNKSVRSVAREADLTHGTLNLILAGSSWPDMLSISKLERALGVDLWPGHAIDESVFERESDDNDAS